MSDLGSKSEVSGIPQLIRPKPSQPGATAATCDEDPELRPWITAVLLALGKVGRAFRKHVESFQAEERKSDTRSDARANRGAH